MVIRSTAFQSALAGMTAAHQQLAVAAQSLAQPLCASPVEFFSANSSGDRPSSGSESPAVQSMSAEIGDSLISLHESLTQARANSATAGAAQDRLEELLSIGRR